MATSDYGPLYVRPVNVRAPFDVRVPIIHDMAGYRLDKLNALREALTGVELGAYDHLTLDWLAGSDIPTVGAFVSLLHRARIAGGAR